MRHVNAAFNAECRAADRNALGGIVAVLGYSGTASFMKRSVHVSPSMNVRRTTISLASAGASIHHGHVASQAHVVLAPAR